MGRGYSLAVALLRLTSVEQAPVTNNSFFFSSAGAQSMGLQLKCSSLEVWEYGRPRTAHTEL